MSSIEENITEHTLEDTIKNLKHATDSLASIMWNYRECSVMTIRKINVLTAHIIKDKITLIKYGIGINEKKWIAVETRSATVPLDWDDRKDMVKFYDSRSFS